MSKHSSLVSFGLALALLFGLAFKCGSDHQPSPVKTPGSARNSAGPTEDVVKQYIKRGEERFANPELVNLTFETIQFGAPRSANEQDGIDGINSDTVYPLRVRFTTTRRTTQGEQKQSFYNNYNFYKDSYGEWNATNPGSVR